MTCEKNADGRSSIRFETMAQVARSSGANGLLMLLFPDIGPQKSRYAILPTHRLYILFEPEIQHISNRDVKLLDHCIGLLERKQNEELAHRLLDRYTEISFDTPQEWRTWFVQHEGRLFFSDSAGYKFRVRPD